jgi:hypothetical protein
MGYIVYPPGGNPPPPVNSWLINGNINNPGDFIGTDLEEFIINAANFTVFRSDSNVLNQNLHIGAGAGLLNNGNYNTLIGQGAGNSSNAQFIIGIGYNAAEAIDANSILTICIGTGAGIRSNGSYNTFIGQDAGRDSIMNNSLAIGNNSGLNCTGNDCIYLGSNAGRQTIGGNAINNNTIIRTDFLPGFANHAAAAAAITVSNGGAVDNTYLYRNTNNNTIGFISL